MRCNMRCSRTSSTRTQDPDRATTPGRSGRQAPGRRSPAPGVVNQRRANHRLGSYSGLAALGSRSEAFRVRPLLLDESDEGGIG